MDERRQYYTIRQSVVMDYVVDFGRPLTKEEAIKAFSIEEFEDIVDEQLHSQGYVQEVI